MKPRSPIHRRLPRRTSLLAALCLAAAAPVNWSAPAAQAATAPSLTDGSLRSMQSGRCPDVPGGSTANLTRLEIWSCNNGTNQK